MRRGLADPAKRGQDKVILDFDYMVLSLGDVDRTACLQQDLNPGKP